MMGRQGMGRGSRCDGSLYSVGGLLTSCLLDVLSLRFVVERIDASGRWRWRCFLYRTACRRTDRGSIQRGAQAFQGHLHRAHSKVFRSHQSLKPEREGKTRQNGRSHTASIAEQHATATIRRPSNRPALPYNTPRTPPPIHNRNHGPRLGRPHLDFGVGVRFAFAGHTIP